MRGDVGGAASRVATSGKRRTENMPAPITDAGGQL
jgi:hypothetical protein